MAGLMDELNKVVKNVQDGAKELLDKTDIDEKIVSAAKDLKDRAQEALDKTDIDEKLAVAAKDLKDKAQETFEKVRPGVEETLAKAGAGAKDLIDKANEKLNGPQTKDAMDHIREEVDAQVNKIRAAAHGTDPIHDFFNPKPAAEPAPEAEPVAEPEPAPEAEPVTEEPAYDEEESDALE